MARRSLAGIERALTGVQADADMHGVAAASLRQCRRATDGARRAVKCGDELSLGARQLPAAEPLALPRRMVEKRGSGHAVDARVQNGGKHAIEGRPGRGAGRAGHEPFDLVDDGVLIADERQVILARQLDEPARRVCGWRRSGLPRPSGTDRGVRCSTSVGTRTCGRISRMSISAFMRVSASAAPGLAPIRR